MVDEKAEKDKEQLGQANGKGNGQEKKPEPIVIGLKPVTVEIKTGS